MSRFECLPPCPNCGAGMIVEPLVEPEGGETHRLFCLLCARGMPMSYAKAVSTPAASPTGPQPLLLPDDFELFEYSNRFGMTITITTGGKYLHIGVDADREMGAPKGIYLMYSRERRAIGLRVATDSNPRAHRLTRVAGKKPKVRAVVFCERYGLPTEVARRYPLAREGDLWIALLADGVSVGRKRRRKEHEGA